MILLIDTLVDARDVYPQHKFDVGKTRQMFHVKLKPNVELKRQRHSKVPLHLNKNRKNYSLKEKRWISIVRWVTTTGGDRFC